MKTIATQKSALFSAILAVLALGSQSALASGSYGGAGDDSNQAYNLGKNVFYKKLVCKSCPMAGTEVTDANAKDVVAQLIDQPDLGKLSAAEREAVVAYLTRRYKLQ